MKVYNIFRLLPAMLLVVLTLVFTGSSASGGILFSVEIDPPVSAGSNATVSFFGTSTVTGGESLVGFNLPVDIGGDGAGLPTGLSFQTLANTIATGSTTIGGPQNDSPFNTDLIVNIGSGTPFTVADTPTSLFDLIIGTSPGTPVGTFPVIAVSTPFFSATAGDGLTDISGSSSIDPAGGSLEIAAVPEPSSFALAIFGLGSLALRRRRG